MDREVGHTLPPVTQSIALEWAGHYPKRGRMRGNKLALWAGISAFFATLLAIGTIDIFNPTDDVRLLSGIVVGLITAGAVYSKQRLDDEKNARVLGGKIVVNEIGD